MQTHINYIVLFEQLKHLLPMLKAQAIETIEYGDTVTGRIHHRILLDTTVFRTQQFAIYKLEAKHIIDVAYIGSCDIEQTLVEVQRMIQDAHAPKRRSLLARFFGRSHTTNMQYFAY